MAREKKVTCCVLTHFVFFGVLFSDVIVRTMLHSLTRQENWRKSYLTGP